DDQPRIIKRRLATQRAELASVLDFYERSGRLQLVRGDAEPSTVTRAILADAGGERDDSVEPRDPTWVSSSHSWIIGRLPRPGNGGTR
ncbi:MAG: hypothetical protein ACRDGQ_10790, partial [Candidatus Limnocylindrales bacterium]